MSVCECVSVHGVRWFEHRPAARGHKSLTSLSVRVSPYGSSLSTVCPFDHIQKEHDVSEIGSLDF